MSNAPVRVDAWKMLQPREDWTLKLCSVALQGRFRCKRNDKWGRATDCLIETRWVFGEAAYQSENQTFGRQLEGLAEDTGLRTIVEGM
jgi:hypothetical protein